MPGCYVLAFLIPSLVKKLLREYLYHFLPLRGAGTKSRGEGGIPEPDTGEDMLTQGAAPCPLT